MKYRTQNEVKKFEEALNECTRTVWLRSVSGKYYNLKSAKEHDAAMAEWVRDTDNETEIYTNSYEDEAVMMKFIRELKAA